MVAGATAVLLDPSPPLAVVKGRDGMKKHRLRVRELAQARGLNISTLSHKAELALGTARGYWHGTINLFDGDVLERIATALGVCVGDLFERLPDDKSEEQDARQR